MVVDNGAEHIMVMEKQKKAMAIFQMVLELILGLFKAHHSKDLKPTAQKAE